MPLPRHPWFQGCLIAAVTVITGSGNLPQAPPAQTPAQAQAATQPQTLPQARTAPRPNAACPSGFYPGNGGCLAYSWSGANTTTVRQGPPELPP